MNDIFTKTLKLPLSVKGLVVPAPDGDYQILLNSAYSPEQQLETYRHEMRHILLGHYEQPARPLPLLEAEASDKALILDKITYASHHGLPPPSPPGHPRPITVSMPARQSPPVPFAPAAVTLHRLRRAHLTGMLTPCAFTG